MILRAAGHGGLFNPIEYGNERRKMPAWMWAAIGVSVVLHVAGGIFLLTQQFVTPIADDGETGVIHVITYVPPPPPPPPAKPIAAPPKAIPVRSPLNVPPQIDTTPIAPNPNAMPGDTPHIATPTEVTQEGATGTGQAPAPPAVIHNPTWVSQPTAAQMERVYPTRALEQGVGGRAVI